MHGAYAEYIRNNNDDDLIILEDRNFFKSISNSFLSQEIGFEEYKKFIFERLSLINLEYMGYNNKKINDSNASLITSFIVKCIASTNDDDYIENCFRAVSCMIHFQIFDDANHRTGSRLLDMLLSYKGYDLDIKKVFEENKESMVYAIPLIYGVNDKIDIDDKWYDSIKLPNSDHQLFNGDKKSI